jgi:hypothetical protein
MHDDVIADAKWVLMWHILIDCWCVIPACVENYIKWLLVGHLYIAREDWKRLSKKKYKRPTLHNFSCILCRDCIYYETDLRDSLLYWADSWVISCAWRTVPSTQGYTFSKAYIANYNKLYLWKLPSYYWLLVILPQFLYTVIGKF